MTDPKPLAAPLSQPRKCKHNYEERSSSEPTAAGMHVESYLECIHCGDIADPAEVAAPLPEPTSRPKPWNAHQRTNERLASELSEATLIIRGFLVFPEMTMDQRKDCIDDARKFLKTLLD